MQNSFTLHLPNNQLLIINQQSHIVGEATEEETKFIEQDCEFILGIYLNQWNELDLSDLLTFEKEFLFWKAMLFDERTTLKNFPIYTNLSCQFKDWFLEVERKMMNRLEHFSN